MIVRPLVMVSVDTIDNAVGKLTVILSFYKRLQSPIIRIIYVSFQDMDLKNGRKEPVNVVVTDQLPKSNDDKVKVSTLIYGC